MLKELQENLGFSCLFISHDLAVVEMLADKIVVLQQGRVVESGTTHQVLHEPKEQYTKRLVARRRFPIQNYSGCAETNAWRRYVIHDGPGGLAGLIWARPLR